MKKHVLSLLVLVALVLVGCEQPVKPVVTIEPTTLTLLVGDTSTLNITVSPAETVAEIVWSSSNSEVASVDANGVVVALAEGTANITASIEGAEPAICSVIVEQIRFNLDMLSQGIETQFFHFNYIPHKACRGKWCVNAISIITLVQQCVEEIWLAVKAYIALSFYFFY